MKSLNSVNMYLVFTEIRDKLLVGFIDQFLRVKFDNKES